MPLQWTELAENSLFEILTYYETVAGLGVADAVEKRIFEHIQKISGFEVSTPESDLVPSTRKLVIPKLPYVAFIRQRADDIWEVVDIVHTSRKFPKGDSNL